MASPTKEARADAKKIIASARRPERSFELCLRGDLQARWEALDRQLVETARAGAASLEGDDRVDIAEQMEALRSEMLDATLSLTLRALPRDEFRSIEARHPPRKAPETPEAGGEDDHEHHQAVAVALRDKQAGVNVDTFYPALLRACIVDDLDDDDWDGLLDVVTDRQFDELSMTAWLLNKGEVAVPFSPTASRLTRKRDES